MSSGVALLGVALVGFAAGVLLRARLGSFAHRLPAERELPVRRTGWVIPATGVLGALLWAAVRHTEPVAVGVVFVLAGWTMVALAFIDLDVHRLPDAIHLPSYPILLVLLAICAASGGAWSALARAVGAGVVLFVFYFVLLLLPSGFGFGDVKLAGLLGLLLGWLGWDAVVRGTFATFIVGGVVAGVLMLSRRKDRRDEFAYGPSMLAGAVVAVVLSALSG
ncbi:hypothetical protein GCM10011492_38120 [Flexivirga endophytica]|uniref:Prepilin type IV endopeptidase peptidase domain-containing protein n=1 Tax=Flexivirga endophytica TaxID=1849103 RepID=A0A916WZ14_9MICO|nr:A24 family peptidase [Flexivirga endophytica]GGB43493.1 hypothetical protein GCM10011492_38120 [Flexivirga endophytica]GHB68352.1 hypothetical protein GCM10008112_41390 [Flexivirga endophytica]